jgi:hypothetical protein
MLLVDAESDKIEDGNDIGWVVFELFVEGLSELEEVLAIDVEHILFGVGHFLEFGDVMRLDIELIVSHV